jgi:small nuclear ribonucleoprotein (snRNP)-like protein
MLSLINWRLKVTLNDGRQLVGQMLAYDKHMNLVLAECEEFRHVRAKTRAEDTGERPEQEIKRTLGLVILRGEIVVSLSVEGPPPVQDEDSKNMVSGRAQDAFACRVFGCLVLNFLLSWPLALVEECRQVEGWE